MTVIIKKVLPKLSGRDNIRSKLRPHSSKLWNKDVITERCHDHDDSYIITDTDGNKEKTLYTSEIDKEVLKPVIPKEINTKEIPSSVPLEPDTKKINTPKIVHPKRN